MKYILVLVIVSLVCALALSHAINREDDDPKEEIYFATHFEHLLIGKSNSKREEIVNAWKDCNSIFKIPFDKAIDLFQNPPREDARNVTKEAKCLIDCTLLSTGANSHEGFREAVYMDNIKQLLMNHTSFDLRKKSTKTQRKILETIAERASHLPSYLVKEDQFFTKLFYTIPSLQHYTTNSDLIPTYAWAAKKCKNLKDPANDTCETSFMIVRCIMDRNREGKFNSPFYPISKDALQ